jgi:hypothetical protein
VREAVVVLGAVVGTIVLFTVLTGGQLHIGTASTGPFFNLGFKGPQG